MNVPPNAESDRGLTSDGMANECTHMSATGIDQAPWADKSKVWACDHCGLRWRTDGAPINLNREAAAIGWDAAVASLTYPDGSPVEVISTANPYRPFARVTPPGEGGPS